MDKTNEHKCLASYEPLLPAEKTLLRAARLGKVAWIREKRPTRPTHHNTIRAELLRYLLIGGEPGLKWSGQGPRVYGAWISGSLNLREMKIDTPIFCRECRFERSLLLSNCTSKTMDLGGSLAPGVDADGVKIEGDIAMNDGFTCLAEFRMIGAMVKGDLDLSGGKFIAREIADTDNRPVASGDSISADRSRIFGSVFLRHGFRTNGTVRLLGAKIGSNLDCQRGHFFSGRNAESIIANRSSIRGHVLLSGRISKWKKKRFVAHGSIDIENSAIGGSIKLQSATLNPRRKNRAAISLKGTKVSGNLHMDTLWCRGYIRIENIRVIGSVELLACRILNARQTCLNAAGCIIGGNFRLGSRPGTKTPTCILGRIVLENSIVRGNLDLRQATILNPTGRALSAKHAKIEGSALLCKGFKSLGCIDFDSVNINGELDLRDAIVSIPARVTNEDHTAFYGAGMRVHGAFFLARSENHKNKENTQPIVSSINVASSHIDRIYDSIPCWGNPIYINGMRYRSIAGIQPTSAEDRIKWLDRQDPSRAGTPEGKKRHDNIDFPRNFRTQPWHQLSRTLNDMGQKEDARKIAIEFEKRLWRSGIVGTPPPRLNPLSAIAYKIFARLFHMVFGELTGYGYRPARLIVYMAIVWLLCAGAYWMAAGREFNVFAPTNPLIFHDTRYEICMNCEENPQKQQCLASQKEKGIIEPGNWYLCPLMREEYSGFSPLAYSLDVLLPLVDLQQEKHWAPMVPGADPSPLSELSSLTPKHITRLIIWAETIFGWIASLLLAAIVSGLTRRRED